MILQVLPLHHRLCEPLCGSPCLAAAPVHAADGTFLSVDLKTPPVPKNFDDWEDTKMQVCHLLRPSVLRLDSGGHLASLVWFESTVYRHLTILP